MGTMIREKGLEIIILRQQVRLNLLWCRIPGYVGPAICQPRLYHRKPVLLRLFDQPSFLQVWQVVDASYDRPDLWTARDDQSGILVRKGFLPPVFVGIALFAMIYLWRRSVIAI